jgi:hypothetical protein
MCALEIAVFPGLKRETTFDWIGQIFFVVASAAGIVSAVAALLERRRGLVYRLSAESRRSSFRAVRYVDARRDAQQQDATCSRMTRRAVRSSA